MAFNIYFDSQRQNNNSEDEYIIANSFAEFKQQVYRQQCFPIAVSINSDLKEHSIQIVEWLVRMDAQHTLSNENFSFPKSFELKHHRGDKVLALRLMDYVDNYILRKQCGAKKKELQNYA